MVNVSKTIPNELDGDSIYSIRIRSVNSFGIPSDWSEALVIDTDPAALTGAGRLVITEDGMFAYTSEGRMAFGYYANSGSRVNQVRNPSFESNTTGWLPTTTTTLTRTTSDSFFTQTGLGGSASIAANAASVLNVGFEQAATHRIIVVPAEMLTVSAYIKTPIANRFRIGFRFYNVGGTLVSESIGARDLNITTPLWTRITNIAVRVPVGAVQAAVIVYSTQRMSPPQSYLVDGVIVEKSDVLREYFDGSTSAGGSSWTGAVNNSTSQLLITSPYYQNGSVITSSIIQTNPLTEIIGGIRIDRLGFYAFNPSGVQKVFISATTGDITATDGIFTGSTFRTSTNVGVGSPNAGAGVIFDNLGIRGFSGSGTTPSFSLDTSGAMTATGATLVGNVSASSFTLISNAGAPVARLTNTPAGFGLLITPVTALTMQASDASTAKSELGWSSSAGTSESSLYNFSSVWETRAYVHTYIDPSFSMTNIGSQSTTGGRRADASSSVATTGSQACSYTIFGGTGSIFGSINCQGTTSQGFVSISSSGHITGTIAGFERFRIDQFGAYSTQPSGHTIRIGEWSGNSSFAAIQGNRGYLLVGSSADINVYLRSNAVGSTVNIGGEETNTMTVGNGVATVVRLEANTVSSISGDLNIDASGNTIRLNNWVIPLNPPGTASGATMIFDASNVISYFTSCRELKDKIVSFSDSGSIIDQLNPVTFIEKSKDPENEHPDLTKWREAHIIHGFIAEEVAEVEPRLASWQFDEDENLKPIAWDQFSMISVLVAELKNLRARVLELENSIE